MHWCVDYPYIVNSNSVEPNDPATNEDYYKVVREIGAAGTVVLKNVAGTLSLIKLKFIAIIGARKFHPAPTCALVSDFKSSSR